MKGSVCVYLVFPFLLLCSLGSATLRILSNARLPSLQGEKLIRELNFFPKESINIVHPNDVSTAPITPRIVEKRFKFPNFADPDVSAEDLGHHAGYYTIQHSHAARETAQTGGTSGTQNNMELELLMNVFGGLGAGGLNLPNTLSKYVFVFHSASRRALCYSTVTTSRNGFL